MLRFPHFRDTHSFYLAIILGPIVELPMLLLIARMMLVLKDRIGVTRAVGHDQG